MAKSVPFPDSAALLEIAGSGLFEKIIPFAVQEAAEEYKGIRDKKIEEIQDKIKDVLTLSTKYVFHICPTNKQGFGISKSA